MTTGRDVAGDSREQRGAEREAALDAYDVLSHPPRRALVSLVDLAARVVGVPYATVNLFTSDTQHQVATVGFEPHVIPLTDVPCKVVLESGEAFQIDDARNDPRLADIPTVTGDLASIRYYGAHPLRTPGGTLIGTLCVFDEETHPVTEESARGLAQLADRVVDVLELELASRRLNEVNERLSTSNERLAHFAGQVSHDLKNPLTSVSLSLESLEMEVSDDYQSDTVARARRGVERMTGLINNLLEFASQGVAPGDDVVDLDAVLDAALDDLAGRVSRDQISREALPRVRGDAAQLRSVLMNLIDNAAKFTLDGDEPDIEVAALSFDGCHRIEVRDRGRGIPDDKQERVFAPLARLDKTVDGTGIGLATCRRIVESHGGSMGVDDREGGGSVFWFELPDVAD